MIDQTGLVRSARKNKPPVPVREPMEAGRSFFSLFWIFLKLGLTSFGGPIAHLGYFRKEFVEKRQWLEEREYAELVALCQFLPGPASSQTGIGIGMLRGRWLGALAAWLGFTLPSALLMIGLGLGVNAVEGLAGWGLVAGLKIAAVLVVIQAVWSMAHSLCPDTIRKTLAVEVAVLLFLFPWPWMQVFVILLAAVTGMILFQDKVEVLPKKSVKYGVSRSGGWVALGIWGGGLILLPVVGALYPEGWLGIADRFFRAGALVFGGGHVVLPLLEAEMVVPGVIQEGEFLAGYAAAQALPGPLFAFAGYLGAVSLIGPTGWLGGLGGVVFIFLPGALILIAVLPFWEQLRRFPIISAAVLGANAGVVGVLAAALYDPIFISSIHGSKEMVVLALGSIPLFIYRLPVWITILVCAVLGMIVL